MCPGRSITIHESEVFWTKVVDHHLGRLFERYGRRLAYLDALKINKVAPQSPEFLEDINKEEALIKQRQWEIGNWDQTQKEAYIKKAEEFSRQYADTLKYEPGPTPYKARTLSADFGLWTPGGSLRLVKCGIDMDGGPGLRGKNLKFPRSSTNGTGSHFRPSCSSLGS